MLVHVKNSRLFSQNRESTKVCSKCIVRIIISSLKRRICLNKYTMCKSQIGRDQVSGGVTVPCRHATPVANALWKPLIIR